MTASVSLRLLNVGQFPQIQMSPDVVCFLIADAVFNGFVYFRILSCERTLRRKFGNSRNCSSGITMTTYPRFSPERDSTTISVLWATTSKRTLLLISNNEYGKCRMTRQQEDFYEARGKAILEKTFPGPERADLQNRGSWNLPIRRKEILSGSKGRCQSRRSQI